MRPKGWISVRGVGLASEGCDISLRGGRRSWTAYAPRVRRAEEPAVRERSARHVRLFYRGGSWALGSQDSRWSRWFRLPLYHDGPKGLRLSKHFHSSAPEPPWSSAGAGGLRLTRETRRLRAGGITSGSLPAPRGQARPASERTWEAPTPEPLPVTPRRANARIQVPPGLHLSAERRTLSEGTVGLQGSGTLQRERCGIGGLVERRPRAEEARGV